jgi:hypothetical protein
LSIIKKTNNKCWRNKEPSFTVGGCNYYENQCGGSSKNQKYTYLLTPVPLGINPKEYKSIYKRENLQKLQI